ncbi:hypothetical protein LCGC14_1103590 [marine sediment metagenome]|uniref:Uncharacterized protein n=1 Tax=marine sediment metagenome TaxID=412755 RepID=A0A0F9MWQ9_9ZZZZ
MITLQPAPGQVVLQLTNLVDIHRNGDRWQWIHYYHAGKLPGYSSESYATAEAASHAAEMIADAHEIGISSQVLNCLLDTDNELRPYINGDDDGPWNPFDEISQPLPLAAQPVIELAALPF